MFFQRPSLAGRITRARIYDAGKPYYPAGSRVPRTDLASNRKDQRKPNRDPYSRSATSKIFSKDELSVRGKPISREDPEDPSFLARE